MGAASAVCPRLWVFSPRVVMVTEQFFVLDDAHIGYAGLPQNFMRRFRARVARLDGRAAVPGIGAFEDVVVKELVPMIDANYRTLADRDHRAIAGLSMGAFQTLTIGTHHLDMFAYMGGFSGTMNIFSTEPLDPATSFDGVFKDGAAFNAKAKLFWIGLGTDEPPFFHKSFGAFREMLDKAGVKYVFFPSPGTAHEWLTWRRDLYDFAPRLFR